MAGKHQYPLNTKVRLKDDRDRSYALAPGGSEGWVRKQKIDYPSTPMVYIEWDTNHWRYQGEPNQWTFEDHFEPVEETKMAEDKQISVDKLIAAIQAVANEDETPSERPQEAAEAPAKPESTLPLSTPEEYAERLETGAELAKDADAFIIISVTKKEIEDRGHVNAANLDFGYRTEQAGYLLEAQLATTVAEIVRSSTLIRLAELAEDEDEPGR